MSTRLFSILSALSCILGVAMIIISFVINPGPPPNATGAQLATFGKLYHNAILLGGWLQAVGPLLIVLFAFAIVHLAGAAPRFAGRVATLGGMLLMMVTLTEVTFFFAAANSGNLITAQISISLVSAVQHLYAIVAAPALILPLGVIILSSHVLPRFLGYCALVIGSLYAISGLVYLFTPSVNEIAILSVLQFIEELWFPITAITLLIRVVMTSGTAAVRKHAQAVAATENRHMGEQSL